MTFQETETLSQALRLTADDIEHLLDNPVENLQFRMSGWLRGELTADGRPGLCTACLAGIVMIRRFDGLEMLTDRLRKMADAQAKRRPGEPRMATEIVPMALAERRDRPVDDQTAMKVAALDYARVGDYVTAIRMGWPKPITDELSAELEKIPEPMLATRSHFSDGEMRAAVEDLRANIIPRLEAAGR